jgi:hypothetical protein
MTPIFTSILDFFKARKTVYSHRNRTIEIVAQEKGFDIEQLRAEVQATIECQGRVEAIESLVKRFHVPLSAAWRFVDKLDH